MLKEQQTFVPAEKSEEQEVDDGLPETVDSRFKCTNIPGNKFVTQRGSYYVIYNFVKAEKEFECTESITLTAPGDFR